MCGEYVYLSEHDLFERFLDRRLNLNHHQVLLDFRGGAIQFFGTKRHHDKWLKVTEDLGIKGCFSMTELGHGSNVSKHRLEDYLQILSL